ncbi:MAG: hypothetical protein EOO96_18745 [Pedobacter sp.]|nr:MAG: hypothetical protein EOO96_18745 [Pedobacter sp.]
MKKIYFLLSIILLLGISSCKKSDGVIDPPTPVDPLKPYVPDNSFKVVAYFPSYRDPNGVADSKYKMITHLFYAFLNPNVDGSLATLEQPSRFSNVMQKARANGVKTGISISGTRSIFVEMATSASARKLFVKNVLGFARTNNLDGVDMDWEYPSTADGSADNYVLLMKELSAGSVRDGLKSEVFPSVDFFNIMVYDGIGWDKDEPIQHASYNMAVASLNYWLGTRGMPKEKAVLGIPAYGKNAANASKAYRDFVTANADVNLDYATIDGVQYYYNGILTTRKKAKLGQDRANGIMFWEFYHDDNGNKSIIRAANDELGRNYN